MRVTALWMSLMLCATALLADEHSVDFDQHTNFSNLKTFAVREGKINSLRPELNNAIVGKKIADAIRAELKAKGLKETVGSPGTGPARTEGRISAFMKAIRDTIDFANSIADRRADSPDSRARSRELADKLRSLLGP